MDQEANDTTPGDDTLPPLTDKEREAISKAQAERDAQIHDYMRKRDVWPRG